MHPAAILQLKHITLSTNHFLKYVNHGLKVNMF